MQFELEYYALVHDDMPELRRHILLWHIAHGWGRYPRPPKQFPRYHKNTRHPLSLPARNDPPPGVNESGKDLLLRLHQVYGPVVVNLERVALSCPFSVNDVSEGIAYASCSRVLLSLEDLYYRVHTGGAQAHYDPAWVHTSPLVPFGTPDECRVRFDTICHGCLVGMDWTDVWAGGGSVSACLTPYHIETQDALDAYTNMDVDLFVFTTDALVKTIEHFKHKFHAVFGFNRGVVVVCIRHIPRVFQIILVNTDTTSLVTRFDLDFAQVILSETQILLTPACIRAHATRVCHVSPHVLPARQHKARRKGFGLYVSGIDVLDSRTLWDQERVYTGGTDEQTRFNMMLNLYCQHVTADVDDIMHVVNTTDLRNGPEYIPRDTGRYTYTGTAFMQCDVTSAYMFNALPDTLPRDGVLGCNLPFTLVFSKYMWRYDASCEALVLKDPDYVAPGREDLLQFTDRVQSLMDTMYGKYACTYGFEHKRRLMVHVTPSSRILDVHARTMVDLITDGCVCTAVQCSSMVMGDCWWAPVFVCQEIDVFPLCVANLCEKNNW